MLPRYVARYSSMTRRSPVLIVDNKKKPKGKG